MHLFNATYMECSHLIFTAATEHIIHQQELTATSATSHTQQQCSDHWNVHKIKTQQGTTAT
jgi:hypothetical protein